MCHSTVIGFRRIMFAGTKHRLNNIFFFNNYMKMNIHFLAVGIHECVYFNILTFSQYFLNTNLNIFFLYLFFKIEQSTTNVQCNFVVLCKRMTAEFYSCDLFQLLYNASNFLNTVVITLINYRRQFNQSFIGICRVQVKKYVLQIIEDAHNETDAL